jgi:PEP-CTERM motif
MRLLIINLVAVALLLSSAVSASAISMFFSNLQALGGADLNALNAGDQISIQLRLDTEGETQITSVFNSLGVDPALLSFVSGTSPGQILFNTSTFEGVARVSNPALNPSDPAGQVRAANFAAADPSNIGSANQLLATVIFEAVAGAGGTTAITQIVTVGDDVTVNGVVSAYTPAAASGPITVLPIPEPGTALLMGLGLAGLGVAGRRR